MSLILTEPIMLATLPLTPGSPTVRSRDDAFGGTQEGKASGESCVALPDVHWLKAGTSGRYSGVAPFGRAYPFTACQSGQPSLVAARVATGLLPVPFGLIV